VAVLRGACVMVVEPLQGIALQQIALTKQRTRNTLPAGIGDRVAQQLGARLEHRLLPRARRFDCQHRGQGRAGAVATEGHTRTVQAQLFSLAGQPGQGILAVFQGHREAVLRRQPVTHRQHRATGPCAQFAAHAIMAVEAADDKATAVKIHQHRQRGRCLRRPVQAQRDGRTVPARRLQRFDGQALGRCPAQLLGRLLEDSASLLGAHVMERRVAGIGLGQVEKSFKFRMQHGVPREREACSGLPR